MNALRARVTASLANDRGLTLVEVVVAITILAVLSTAELGVYLSGINSSTALQRRDIAVTVASQVLEKANSVIPTALYAGRASAAVATQRSANSGIVGLDQTYLAFDTSVPLAATQSLPISGNTTLAGTNYQVDTLVGTCLQPKTGGACTAPGWPTQPATIPADRTVLSRVIVVVRWTAGSSCRPTACTYVATTLVDANSDLKWNVP